MRRILSTIEGDPALRAGLRGMTSKQIAAFARVNARNRAGELVGFLARRARDSTVRSQAQAALATLR